MGELNRATAVFQALREHRRAVFASRTLLVGVAVAATVSVGGAQAVLPSLSSAAVTPAALTTGVTAPSAALQPESTDIAAISQIADADRSYDVGSDRVRPHVIDKTPAQRVAEVSSDTHYDVPQAALDAYRQAARTVAATDPTCHLSWAVIAGIGQVESDHGRYGGTSVLADGTTYPHIVGLPLNGVGQVASIPDTDNGRLDGDTVWDRAVGPMQFIPTTWAVLGQDGDGNGVKDPHDFDDAALATARYLCGGDVDLSVPAEARAAVYNYNHSADYVTLVLSIAATYDSGVVDVVSNDAAPTKQERAADRAGESRSRHEDHAPRRHSPGRPSGPGDSPKPGPRHHPGSTRPPGGGATDPTPTPKPHPAPIPKPHPQPHPKPTPKPHPKPEPKPDPKPHPKPEPKPDPVPTTVTGLITACDDGWCLNGTALQLGSAADLTTVQLDYDADGMAEPVSAELDGLADGAVEVVVGFDAAGVVTALNGLAYTIAPAVGDLPTPGDQGPSTTGPVTDGDAPTDSVTTVTAD